MNEEFVKFLKKHRAYKRYMKNLYDQKCSEISSAFMWDRTSEGYEYWFKLNKKWNEINSSSSDWE